MGIYKKLIERRGCKDKIRDTTGKKRPFWHLESSSGHIRSFYQNLVKYRFKNMFSRSSTVI